MFRLAIFNPNNLDLSTHKAWMSQEYEIAITTTLEATLPLLLTWKPHILIYYTTRIMPQTLESMRSARGEEMGLMILSAQYNLKDELISFELGTDYYLLFNSPSHSIKSRLNRLTQRGRVLQNLKQNTSIIGLPKRHDIFKFSNLIIYSNQNYVLANEKKIRLTPTEMAILLMFLNSPNITIDRESIRDHIFFGQKISLRTIDAHITKLKKKITPLRETLFSVYGVGYVLKAEHKPTQVA